MLYLLGIRDIVLIERLDIAFAAGLTVLTGETGAGKSILIDALDLALGGRGDAGLVREGAAQGQVTAAFDLPATHPVRGVLRDNGIDNDGDVILRRIQNADGRTRAFVNDQPVSAALLRDLGARLVEIHGQHDDRALVAVETHRGLLDAFGGLRERIDAVAAAHRGWRAAEDALAAHRARVEAATREAEFLRAAVDELSALQPSPGEEEILAERRQRMIAAEKIAADLSEAFDTLNGPASPVPTLAGLTRRLERKADRLSLLAGTIASLSAALDALEEARSGLESAMRAADFDARELETTEERLFALRATARKHGVSPDALAALAERFAGELAELDAGADRLAVLESEVLAARAAYDALAVALSQQRAAAAGRLEAQVHAELPALKLDHARFIVAITASGETRRADGLDVVEFWVQTNPGTRPGPMMKVASGGELARFLLALKVSLAEKGSAPTLVFDEIDAGVGGAVAEAIGMRLARLAAGVQVLSVTHAPQVAARAGSHLLIAKDAAAEGGRMGTRVVPLADGDRREEIARMLAGSVVTAEARAAADRLMAGGG